MKIKNMHIMVYLHIDWMVNSLQTHKLHRMQFPNLQKQCQCLFSRLLLATKAILRSVSLFLSPRPPSGFITELLWINIQRFPRQHGQLKMSPKPNRPGLCYKEWLLPNHRATYNWWWWAWWWSGVTNIRPSKKRSWQYTRVENSRRSSEGRATLAGWLGWRRSHECASVCIFAGNKETASAPPLLSGPFGPGAIFISRDLVFSNGVSVVSSTLPSQNVKCLKIQQNAANRAAVNNKSCRSREF